MFQNGKSGAVREERPPLPRRGLKIGDRVRIVDIPVDLKDPEFDRKHDPNDHRMRTAELFRFCLGRVFRIYGFGRYGHVELHVGNSPAVRKKFGNGHSIWCEPEFLKRVGRARVQGRNLSS